MTDLEIRREKKWCKFMKKLIGRDVHLRNPSARELITRYRKALNEISCLRRAIPRTLPCRQAEYCDAYDPETAARPQREEESDENPD